MLPPCYITPPCLPPNYQGFPRWFAVLSRVWQTLGRVGAFATVSALPPPFDYRHAVLHYTTVFTTKLSGISAMVRCFIACVRQTLGRVGACSRRVTSHHRVIPPNYRGFSRWFAVLLRVWQTWGRAGACSRRVTSHHRVIPPNYRGFSRWFAVLSHVCGKIGVGWGLAPTA